MSNWAIVAAGYGGIMTIAALAMPVHRRLVAVSAGFAYVLVAVALGTLPRHVSLELIAPAVLLLAGYWLSGLLFRGPHLSLEAWLRRTDGIIFRALRIDRVLERAPLWALELLEAFYLSVYAVIATGALVAAVAGGEALSRFWTLVLAAELACYVWLPWVRSRPPRALEPPGVMARRAPRLRRWNSAVLASGSVQANTLPSGHVAGAVAAALGVLPLSGGVALALLAASAAIAIAATAGRYHYAVDCAAGALVAVLLWSVL
jgi:PAP2 superfamily protein